MEAIGMTIYLNKRNHEHMFVLLTAIVYNASVNALGSPESKTIYILRYSKLVSNTSIKLKSAITHPILRRMNK